MSVLSIVKDILGGSPGAPEYAQPFVDVGVTRDFAAAVPGGLSSSIVMTLNAAAEVRTPANGLLRYVPSAAEQAKEPFLTWWPDLRLLDGSRLEPVEGQVLFEMWPTAFRRLEGVFSTNEGPIPGTKATLPLTPLPRWFLFGGISKPQITARVTAIAKAQFPPAATIGLAPFFLGAFPVYAPVNTAIAREDGSTVEVWAFDTAGLVVDPAVYCGYVKDLADDVFGIYAVGDTSKLPFTPRHTYVFSDHRGKPYVQWKDPDPPVGPLPPPPPSPKATFGGGAVERPLEAKGVLTFKSGESDWTALKDKLVSLHVAGEHARVGLHPHGLSANELKFFFGEWAFARVRVTDLAEWFPRNDDPKNILSRYTEQNELVPLVDGQAAFREMYRAYRSTYRKETYASDDDMPAGAARSDAEIAPARILMTNFQIAPESSLLGRRAMLTTSRTQAVDKIEGNPLDSAQFIPAASIAGGEQSQWWLVGASGGLPPGACVELQPITTGASLSADDPRIPGKDRGADLYGITIFERDTVSAFVNAEGRFFLPISYPVDWDRKAELRIVTWKPSDDDGDPATTATSGKGRKIVHAKGTITVPAPPSLTIPPVGAPWSATPAFVLTNNGGGNGGLLTIESGSLTAAATIAVVNQRSGDSVLQNVSSFPGDVTIELPGCASNDTLLVGALPMGGTDAAACPAFFAVGTSMATQSSGFIPAHPKELIGTLRQAIDAGVEVRLLAFREGKAAPEPTGTFGMVLALNAAISGKRGEAIADPLVRETSSHHQKTSFIRSSDGVAALIGGVDHLPSRWAGANHDAVDPDRPTNSLWHDTHCFLRGKAAWDIYRNFVQRWNAARVDPRVTGEGVSYTPLPPVNGADVDNPAITPVAGTHAVQINRTLPPHIDGYVSFMDNENGQQAILQSYERTIARARHFLYIEEQYFWNVALAQQINQRLRDANGPKFAVLVLPKELSEFPVLDLVLYAIRVRAVNMLLYGKAHLEVGEDGTALPGNVSDRVLVVHPVNDEKEPVYVHCKMIVADDVWMSIGSSNINRRSMTYDSELNAASIDGRIRRGAHLTARDLRTRQMAHHLGLDDLERPIVEDPRRGFALFKAAIDKPPAWLVDRHHLVAYDPKANHYGIQPAEYNQIFLDALNLLLDPDGRQIDLATDLSEVATLLKALAAADETDGATFGGLGTIHATFTFPPAVVPHHLHVEVTDTATSDKTEIGPLAPGVPATLGIHRNGKTYAIAAQALDISEGVLATAALTVVAAGFVTEVVLPFA
jgi:phosphatidylserine/phosphatidylglycerophosphate/cardiolipin synthase-like enzyme